VIVMARGDPRYGVGCDASDEIVADIQAVK